MSRKWSDETDRARGLHKRDRYVLCELGKVANKVGRSWYRQSTFAEKIGMSERTLRTALANLEDFGWIVREREWHRDGKRRGERMADVIQLRTLDQAAAFVAARLAEEEGVQGGGDGDGPGPGRPAEVTEFRQAVAAVSTPQHVNTSARQQSPGRQAAALRRQRDAADRQADHEAEAERAACEAAAGGDIRDLAARLKAAGHEISSLDGDPPSSRRVTG